MLVADSVLVSIRLPSILSFGGFDEASHISIVIHLQIHTDSPVEGSLGAVNLSIGNSNLDDLGQLSTILLICSDADFGSFSTIDVAKDCRR